MITVSSVSNNQTWAILLNRVNTLCELMTQNVVTADASTTGSITVGNTQLVGIFSANTIAVDRVLRGGNVATSNTLNIVGNTVLSMDNSTVLSIKKTAGSVDYIITANTINVNTDDFDISSSNTVISGANTNINSFLTVNERSVLNGNVALTGVLTLTGDCDVQGNTFANGAFVQHGTFYHTDGAFDINGPTSIVGTLSVNSNTDVGNLLINGDLDGQGNGSFTGNLTVTDTIFGTVVTPSDRRVKTDVAPIAGGLDMVCGMSGVTYRFSFSDGSVVSDDLRYGLIAQEVEVAAPLAVVTSEAHNYQDFKHVNYVELIPILIEAIKELKAKVEELENGKKA